MSCVFLRWCLPLLVSSPVGVFPCWCIPLLVSPSSVVCLRLPFPSTVPRDRLQKNENRVASDEDLKLSDLLRYYQRDATAVKALLFRRLRCLADYEQANKALEKARAKNKDVHVVRNLCVSGGRWESVVGESGSCMTVRLVLELQCLLWPGRANQSTYLKEETWLCLASR